jgi:hypothetical protein
MQWSRESVEAFLQIVRDVGPAVFLTNEDRGDRRQIHYPFTFRSLY